MDFSFFTEPIILYAMDYWISLKGAQSGPYSLEQLRMMWQQGAVSASTLYYDTPRSDWLSIGELFDSTRKLFNVEEAFVRLGQNRQKGCLTVYNHEEAFHLFVDAGFVVCATGDTDQGELALARAMALEASTYEWFYNADAPTSSLHLNITGYALKNSIARDIRIGATSKARQITESLPKDVLAKYEVKPQIRYVLIPKESPSLSFKLERVTNVLGRDDHCDVVVPETKISRRHCLVEIQEQIVKVKDLGSSNGTYVNGALVRDSILKTGDQLGLGGYSLVLQKEQKRAPALL